MAVLREMFEATGFGEPQSLLQSGNVVFRGSGKSGAMEEVLEQTAAGRLGFHTEFLVRSAREWALMVGANPFREEAVRDPSRLLALVTKTSVSEADVRRLQERIQGRERVARGERVVYAVYPDGTGRSRLTTALIEKTLNSRVTGRNWNTVLKIAAMLAR